MRGFTSWSGFADGNLVSLQAASGEVSWARSLASVSDQFVDVDSNPIARTAKQFMRRPYSGGVYRLEGKDGAVRWRLPIEGI